MKSETELTDLEGELERQDLELHEAMQDLRDFVGRASRHPERAKLDVPQAFFAELEDACTPHVFENMIPFGFLLRG